MSEIIHVKTITQLHQIIGLSPPKHPLISFYYHTEPKVQSYDNDIKFSSDFYLIGMKDGVIGTIGYGRNIYDFEEGTMIFVKPNQVIVPNRMEIAPDSKGWTMVFHPNLIRAYSLSHEMKMFSYFSYDVTEALHLSQYEKEELTEIALKIKREYSQNIDKHTEELIVINLETILKYCKRYYDRQFYTRANQNRDYIIQFEQFIENYFDTNQHVDNGLPTVNQCGEALNMSGHYLSDLLKIETGKGILEHIHLFVIDKAKTELLNSNKKISEIAYNLGFEYAQNFSRLFKSKTGMTPKNFRSNN